MSHKIIAPKVGPLSPMLLVQLAINLERLAVIADKSLMCFLLLQPATILRMIQRWAHVCIVEPSGWNSLWVEREVDCRSIDTHG
jgi:hypothetical protein